ncbi:protein phosphatase 1 regulatory subunit 36 [Grus japonensis]|uniref:Protein phosphatase 1 regulatory subunit 36 n=1 Tax=Grus japonensis TaxID=30415 RepID=A0ABC9X0Z3_GRUJA
MIQNQFEFIEWFVDAALLLKEANESHYMLSFAEVMRNKKLDEFLMALLFYLSFYLEKIALEKKCRSLILTMIFLEKKEMDDVLAKLAVARIHLAKVYSHLILERGMAQQHRMPSGKRKHFQVIREEIGRLLCSNVFNPALRDRSNVDLQKAGDRTADANTIRLPYLRVGIIGAHCSELKSLMNMPDGMMEEEEEKEEEQGRIRTGFSILPNYLSLPAPRSPQNRLSSQSTLLSRRQVEGDCHQSN